MLQSLRAAKVKLVVAFRLRMPVVSEKASFFIG